MDIVTKSQFAAVAKPSSHSLCNRNRDEMGRAADARTVRSYHKYKKGGMQTCHHFAGLHASKKDRKWSFVLLNPNLYSSGAYRATNAVVSSPSGSIRSDAVAKSLQSLVFSLQIADEPLV